MTNCKKCNKEMHDSEIYSEGMCESCYKKNKLENVKTVDKKVLEANRKKILTMLSAAVVIAPFIGFYISRYVKNLSVFASLVGAVSAFVIGVLAILFLKILLDKKLRGK